MNKTKSSNPVRLIAFFLTAFILVCTFGFTVDGWQIGEGEDFGSSADGSEGESPSAPPSDENEENQEEPKEEPEIILPKFYNRITGLETSEAIASRAHMAFVINPDLPSYGISGADLICELPTEDGSSRVIAFLPETDNLWKIGSITNTRGYISNIVRYFGAVCVSAGSDDTIYYTQCDIKDRHLDLSVNTSYQYTEFTKNVYTNRDLLNSGISDLGIDPGSIKKPTLPYDFGALGGEPIKFGEENASIIKINQAANLVTELRFDEKSRQYTLYKNGSVIVDALNDKGLEFTNCFILFADSITYDNSECSQMVMDTIGKGYGYYFTEGAVCHISWVGSGDSTLCFYTEDGERLTANRGCTYISFVKSSKAESLIYE